MTFPWWCRRKASSTAARAVRMSTPVACTSFWFRYRNWISGISSFLFGFTVLHLPDDSLQLGLGGCRQRVGPVLGQDLLDLLAGPVGHALGAPFLPLLPGLAVGQLGQEVLRVDELQGVALLEEVP